MSDTLPINFTISDAAKQGLERLKQRFDEHFPSDPAAVLSIGWGWKLGTAPESGNVAIGFYRRSEEAEVAEAIQEVSEMKLVFFTTEEHHPRFEGRVLDIGGDGGFFLR